MECSLHPEEELMSIAPIDSSAFDLGQLNFKSSAPLGLRFKWFRYLIDCDHMRIAEVALDGDHE